MQQRIRHEHQTPMFSNGFSVAHAIRVQAQMSFTVLIKGLNRPALQIQGEDPLCIPSPPIDHQHGIGACQLRSLKADYQPDFAEPGETHGQRTCPVGFVPYSHRPVCGGRDVWDEVFHSNMGSLQGEGFPSSVLEREAVGLEVPVLLQQTDPVFLPVARHGHQLFREIPTVKQEDTKGYFVLNCCVQQLDAEVDLRTKLVVELLKVWMV